MAGGSAALPVILNAAYAEGEVTLHLAGANRLSLETAGLREVAPAVPAGARNKGGTAWRTRSATVRTRPRT